MSDPLTFLKDVDVRLSVELGSALLPLNEVMALAPDSVVPLNRLTDELLDISVNGRRIAKGEVVVQGNRFALRIVELEGQPSPPTIPPKTAAARSSRKASAPVEKGKG